MKRKVNHPSRIGLALGDSFFELLQARVGHLVGGDLQLGQLFTPGLGTRNTSAAIDIDLALGESCLQLLEARVRHLGGGEIHELELFEFL
jgi:hypothetical protein